MRHTLPLLALILVLVGCSEDPSGPSAGSAATDPLAFIAVDWPERVHILGPGASTTLTARLIDESGAPVAGARVHFLAPDRGPSGYFGDAGSGKIWQASTSDAAGVVHASFVAGEAEGAFFVSAYQATGAGVAHFSVSVTAHPPDEAWKTAALTQAQALGVPGLDVPSAAPPGPADVEGPDILGPLYLPPGTTLRDSTRPGAPIEAGSGAGWFTWVVPSIQTRLGAPSVIVVSRSPEGSSACSEDTVSHETEGVVEATLAGESWSLRAPAYANLELPGAESALATLSVAPAQTPASTPTPTSTTRAALSVRIGECAIIVKGDSDIKDAIPSRFDVSRAYQFFSKRRRVEHVIPAASELEDATVDDFKAYLVRARDLGCKQVILYMVGHANGWDEEACFFFERNTPQKKGENAYDTIKHAELAEAVEQTLGGFVDELTIIIDSCHAERAVHEYQGRGLAGSFLLGTYYGQSAATLPFGSVFTTGLFEAWAEDPTGPANSVMSILQAKLAGEDFSPLFEPSHHALKWDQTPSILSLEPDFTDWNAKAAPNDLRAPGLKLPLSTGTPLSTRDLKIRRPVDAELTRAGVGNGPMNIVVTIADPSIAQIQESAEPTSEFKRRLEPLENHFELPVLGLAEGITHYTVEGRAWHHAFRGTGTIVVGDGCPLNEPCPQPKTACDTRLATSVVVELELGPNTVDEIGIPVVNGKGDVLAWGADGTSGYSLFGPSFLPSFGPIIGAHDFVPVMLGGVPTTILTQRSSLPRLLGDDGSFGFAANLLVGPHVDEQAALAWSGGRLHVLGKTTSHDPARRMSQNVRSNGKGTFAWAIGDLTNDDIGAHREVWKRHLDAGAPLAGTCADKVIAMEEPYALDAGRVVTAVRLHGVDAAGRLILYVRHRPSGTAANDPDDQHAILTADEAGELTPLLQTGQILLGGYQLTGIDFVASDPPSGTIFAAVSSSGPNDPGLFQALVLSTTGTTPRLLDDGEDFAPPEGFDPTDANEFLGKQIFVGSERVAFTGTLSQTDSASANYGPRGTALFIERPEGIGAPLLAMREGAPAPCRPGWVFSSLTLPETQVFFAGAERVYVKAAIRSLEDSNLGSYGLWLVENDSITPVFIAGEPVTLPNQTSRTVSNFGLFEQKGAGGDPDYPDSAATNELGQIVLAVQYQSASSPALGRGIWLIGQR